jgi:hypothetical protein
VQVTARVMDESGRRGSSGCGPWDQEPCGDPATLDIQPSTSAIARSDRVRGASRTQQGIGMV